MTVREKQGWFRSYWEHFRWGALLPPPPFISQPFPLTVLYQPFAQYWRLVSQRLGCGAITQFPPWIVSADEKQRFLHGFDEHIESLKKAVAPEKLLIYNILEGWDPLCHFLELPVPVGIDGDRLSEGRFLQCASLEIRSSNISKLPLPLLWTLLPMLVPPLCQALVSVPSRAAEKGLARGQTIGSATAYMGVRSIILCLAWSDRSVP